MKERDLYIQKLEAQINEWQADIDKLKAKLAGASVGTKLEINQHITSMESNLEEAKSKLDELRKASDDSWEMIKADVEKSWDSIKSAFQDAYTKVL